MATPQSPAPAQPPTLAVADDSRQLQRSVELLTSRIHQLEEENHCLAEKLRQHGVVVATASRVSLELPPPLDTPLDKTAAILPFLTPVERQLAEELWRDGDVLLFTRSETPVDVGNWLRRAPVCAGAMRTELLLFAAGKKPYMETVAFRNLRRSLYNHVTGELVLAPAPSVRHTRLKMAPAEAYQFLAQFYGSSEGEQV